MFDVYTACLIEKREKKTIRNVPFSILDLLVVGGCSGWLGCGRRRSTAARLFAELGFQLLTIAIMGMKFILVTA